MSSEWRTYQLHDAGRIVTGKTPKGGVPEFEGDEVPFVSPPDFSGNKWITKTVRYISEAGAQSVKGSLIPPHSVLVTCIGSDMGKAAIAALRCVTNQQINAVLVDESKFCPEFLYYNLSLRKDEIHGLAGGSAQPILNKSAFSQIDFEAPTLEEQRQIAAALRPLDDRITLLRETNATLEAIAQALFKSWFVDFDPVRAKMEGRAPEGMDEATAALFPDALEESELGWVPKGWDYSKLADTCTYLSRGLSPKYIEQGGVLVLNQKCIRDFSVDYAKGRRHDPALRKIDGRELAVGDVLVNSTGVGTLGRVAQVLELPEQAIVDSHVTVVRAGARLSWPYLGQWMAKKQPDIEAMGEGSTGQTELSRAKLGELKILVPSKQVLVAFDSAVEPLKNRVSLNERSAQTLSTLRDTLLPRLISGQLRLPEAQATLEATP